MGVKIFKNIFSFTAKQISVLIFYVFLPVLPALLSATFAKPKFVLNYWATIKKLMIYIDALKEGPLDHYFKDVVGLENEVPPTIEGSCVKCGNCCLNKRCIFLEQTNETEFHCGIYTSPLRNFSNCNSFPLNAKDIARYECPSYFVSNSQTKTIKISDAVFPIQWINPESYAHKISIEDNVAASK